GSRSGCASAAIGFRAAACRSTSSGRAVPRLRACGCLTKAYNLIVAADKVAILGAGAVGCFIGGCWKAAQLPVTFIGRPRMAADIAANGLTISDYNGWRDHLSDIDYRTEPSALAEASTILVCVKSGATAQAAADIAEHGRA